MIGFLVAINIYLVYKMFSKDTDKDVRDILAMFIGVSIMYLVTRGL